MATELIAQNTVPGTDVVIKIEVKRADPRLAKLLGDKPGTRLWVDQYTTTREIGSSLRFGNYLLVGTQKEEDARKQANFLWTDTVTRRDAQA